MSKILEKNINKLFVYIDTFRKSKSVQQIFMVSFLIFISKVFGFAKNIQLLSLKPQSDAYINAQKIQELLISSLIMGTIISVMIPTGTKLIKLNDGREDKLNRYIKLNFWIYIIIFGIISIVTFCFTEKLLNIIALPEIINSFKDQGVYEDFINAAKVLAFGVMAFAQLSLFTSYLNIKENFMVTNLTGVLTAFTTVIALAFSGSHFVFWANFALFLSFVLSAVILIVISIKSGLGVNGWGLKDNITSFKEFKSQLKSDFMNMIPKIFLIPVPVIVSFVLLATYKNAGTSTDFEIASNIQTIFTLVLFAMNSVLLPKLSSTFYNFSHTDFINQINKYLSKIIPISILAAIITFFGGSYVLWFMLFLKNKGQYIPFDQSQNNTITLIQILAVGLIPLSINTVLSQYFIIKNKIKAMLTINFISILAILITVFIAKNYFNQTPESAVSHAENIALFTTSLLYYYIMKKDVTAQNKNPLV